MNKDFEQIFKPMYYFTTMCSARKIDFKNYKISQINKKNIIISVLGILLLNTGILILYCMTLNQFISQMVSPIIFNFYISAYSLFVVNHAILHIKNFAQRNNNLTLFLTLREIYKHLSLRKQLRKIKLLLFLPFTVCIFGYLIFFVCKLSMDPQWTWARGLLVYSSLIFDLELVYSAFILLFISNNIKTWAKILINIDERINNYEAVIRKMVKVFHMLIDAVIFNKKAFQLTVINKT